MKFLGKVSKIETIVSAITLSAMVFLGVSNVFSRYLFNYSMAASSQFLVILLPFLTLVASASGIKKDRHVGLELITKKLPENLRFYLKILKIIILIIFFSVLFLFGLNIVIEAFKYGQLDSVLGWPIWTFYITYPIGAAFCVLESIAKLYDSKVKFL